MYSYLIAVWQVSNTPRDFVACQTNDGGHKCYEFKLDSVYNELRIGPDTQKAHSVMLIPPPSSGGGMFQGQSR